MHTDMPTYVKCACLYVLLMNMNKTQQTTKVTHLDDKKSLDIGIMCGVYININTTFICCSLFGTKTIVLNV